MDETPLTLIDQSLAGDVSSVYTAGGALEGPNCLVLPPKPKKAAGSGTGQVRKLPSKRSLRAVTRQRTKERLKSIRSEVQAGLRQLTEEQESAVRLLSHLLNNTVPKAKFEEMYAEIERSGAKIPEVLQKKHATIQRALAAKAAREAADEQQEGDF